MECLVSCYCQCFHLAFFQDERRKIINLSQFRLSVRSPFVTFVSRVETDQDIEILFARYDRGLLLVSSGQTSQS